MREVSAGWKCTSGQTSGWRRSASTGISRNSYRTNTERELPPLIETLADAGFCPTNGDRVLKTQHVPHCLSLMCSCGMYDFSFEVGLPAKSGVGGAILAAIPNVMGLCTWRTPRDMNTSRSILSTRDRHSHRGPAGKGRL